MQSTDRTRSMMGKAPPPGDGDVGGAYLLVIANDSASIFHLPRSGEVVIGRGGELALQLGHPSVSRRHALIRVEGGVIRVSDLGSHNGTRVNGDPVGEARTVASGDVVMFGDVVCVVQVSRATPPARGVLPELPWKRRLAEELERATKFGRSLAVIAVLDPEVTVPALAQALRFTDVAGQADDGQPLLLLPDTDREQARRVAEAVLAVARRARLGLAVCPCDAVDPETILAAARGAARRAAPGKVADPAEVATRIALGERTVLVADPQVAKGYAQIERLARTPLAVLVRGETGTGKENAARAVHHFSGRRGSLVVVNCAAVAPNLVESELFGHDRGAFTGATAARPGVFESADGGTVFLDEIGDLPLDLQPKLLRVLETGEVTRLGESKPRKVDVRVVSATHRDLDAATKEGSFRRDLFYRLNGATVILPPLRERRSEIPLLARELLARACARARRGPMTITGPAMQRLLSHDWPGNVRELCNVMERAMANAPDDRIELSDLQLDDAEPAASAPPDDDPPPPPAGGGFRPIADEIRELERRRMREALEAAGGVKTRAAELISMPIRTFTMKAKKYGL